MSRTPHRCRRQPSRASRCSLLLAGLWASVAVHTAHAAPSLLWSPDAATRSAVELLVDDGGMPLTVMQWPLPVNAVQRAVDALPSALQPALDAARGRVRASLQRQASASTTLMVRNRKDALSGYGDDATPGSSLRLRSSSLEGSHAAFQVGGRIDTDGGPGGAHRLRFDDSLLATEALGVQVQAWSHRSWWGPGWQSSLALSNNAPAFDGIGLQRAAAVPSESPWLAWLGPWNAEVFIAQTEDVTRPANPFLFGNRLSLRPWSGVEFGLTRMAQWGGRGHEQNVHSFLKMLTGSGTNADTSSEQKNDPANQLAGFDLRAHCPVGLRCTAYAQLMGEDQAGFLPSRYLGLYGVETWSADGGQRYFAEYDETACATPIGRSGIKNCAYRNYAFPQGYTSAGRWIGASSGPDSRVLTLGWIDSDDDMTLRLNVGRVGSRIGRYASPVPDDQADGARLIGASASRGYAIGGSATVTPQASWQQLRSTQGSHTEARLGVTLRMDLDAVDAESVAGLGRSLSLSEASVAMPLAVGAGLVAGAALFDHALDAEAARHGATPVAKAVRHVGDALPVLGAGLAGATWLVRRGSADGDLAFSALAAGVTAYVGSDALKYAVDRARPIDGRGNGDFGHGHRGDSSFPSNHAAVAWAVVTPYAEQYDAPWLYGAAALTNASRVLGRDHWFSDTVAGSVLGYLAGDWFHRRSMAAGALQTGPHVSVTPRSVRLDVAFD